ncbi:MAG: RluA family pseudouridine synthase [Candidatus Dojkabacteria bacterium]
MRHEITQESNLIGERYDKAVLMALNASDEVEADLKAIVSRSMLVKELAKFSTVNNSVAKPSYRLRAGDLLEIDIEKLLKILNEVALLNQQAEQILPEKGDLNIIAETADFLIVNKPAGMVVHPGVANMNGTLANYLKFYLEAEAPLDPNLKRAGIVHRLDKGVSGLMVVAKTRKTQIELQNQFEKHLVTKLYLAEVVKVRDTEYTKLQPEVAQEYLEVINEWNKNDKPLENWIWVEGYIGRDGRDRKKRLFKGFFFEGSKRAQTYFYPLGENKWLIKLVTGRMHQIRASFNYLGYAIVGDSMYGAPQTSSKMNPDSISLTSVYLEFELFGVKYSYSI